VNFELPPQPRPHGLVSKDLVRDLRVNADRTWQWKDLHDYFRAIDDGIFLPTIRGALQEEATRVLEELDTQTRPFAESFATFRPETQSTPYLTPATAGTVRSGPSRSVTEFG